MKKLILIAVAASALFAGPDVRPLVNYDAHDVQEAQKEALKQPEPISVVPTVFLAPAPVDTACRGGNIAILGGGNFTQSDATLDDAGTAGIRLNKCITKNAFVQVGYDRVFSADYQNIPVAGGNNIRNGRGVEPTNPTNPTAPTGTLLSQGASDTHLDRFYLNGLYEFQNQNRLYPFVFAGLGYERVDKEAYDVKSQGFYNAGAGLNFKLNDKLNLTTQAKAIKKFDNHDLDMVAAVGVGMLFGAVAAQNDTYQPVVTSAPEIEVVPAVIVSEPISSVKTEAKPILVDSAYYIQIAALFKETRSASDQKRVAQLQAQGLNVQTRESTAKGKPVKLLLVGPYYSEAEAKADLGRAKSVEKGAFIKKFID